MRDAKNSAGTEKGQKNTHAPQKVAYPSEHDPRENKWLRLAKERSKL